MKLVAAKCPSCGADLELDKNSDTTKCEYCNSRIIVEDAIAKYKLEVSGKVEVGNMTNFNKLTKLAERLYLDNDYKGALEKYERAIELEPDDPNVVIRLGLCQSSVSTYANFNTEKAIKAMKNGYLLLSDDEENKEKINSYIMETSAVIDKLMNIVGNYYKTHVLNNVEVVNVTGKYYQCFKAYDYLYSIVQDNNSIKERLIKKIFDCSKILKSGFRYQSYGKSLVYLLTPQMSKDISSREQYYVNELNKIHPPQVNSVPVNNKVVKSSSNNKKKIIIPILIGVGIIWFLFMLIVIFAIFSTRYYEGVWTNGNEKVEIDGIDLSYIVDNEEVYSGDYDLKAHNGGYIISFDDYAFKTKKRSGKVFFCQIQSEEETECVKFFDNDESDDEIIKEELN